MKAHRAPSRVQVEVRAQTLVSSRCYKPSRNDHVGLEKETSKKSRGDSRPRSYSLFALFSPPSLSCFSCYFFSCLSGQRRFSLPMRPAGGRGGERGGRGERGDRGERGERGSGGSGGRVR